MVIGFAYDFQIVDRCLLKMKENRWQSAEEMLTQLEPLAMSA